MKKLILGSMAFLCALCGYSQSVSGDEILAFVRSKLPSDPLKLYGTLKVKTPNGFTKASMPVEMELDWGAATPSATYRIGEPESKDFQALTVAWNNGEPSYTFSDPVNEPTGEILDTGVTWADLSFSVLWWPDARLVDEARKLNRECYVVDVPVPESQKTMHLWIEKNMGMLLEAQTVDARKRELTRMKIVSIKKMDGMWVAKDLEIRDKKTGNKTTLQIHELEWKNPKPTAAAFDPVVSVNELAFDLYHPLAAETEGNLFFSPYSISSALAMTYGGARGETAAQMDDVLHFGGPDATHPAFAYLRRSLNNIQEKGHVQLSIANTLWPKENCTFQPDYLGLARKHYGSEIHPADYKGKTEGARQMINAWVEEQTHDKIQNLIAQGALSPETRLVLANAIYFKGDWASQFKKETTRLAPFTLSDGTQVDVPMMSQTGEFKLGRGDKLQAIELPYEGNDLSMVILLPNTGEALVPESLSDLEFRNTEVLVQLPRFALESSFSLDDTLAGLGMPLAFSRQADFSGMTGARELYIDEVVHKAFVEVNEEGTEAAAATAVGMRVTSMPTQFVVNRPFLFLIRENSTGTILFIGRVMNPST